MCSCGHVSSEHLPWEDILSELVKTVGSLCSGFSLSRQPQHRGLDVTRVFGGPREGGAESGVHLVWVCAFTVTPKFSEILLTSLVNGLTAETLPLCVGLAHLPSSQDSSVWREAEWGMTHPQCPGLEGGE